MSKAFESIKQPERGHRPRQGHAGGRVGVGHPAPVDVATVSGRLAFTQAQFAARFSACRWPRSGTGSVATAARKAERWFC